MQNTDERERVELRVDVDIRCNNYRFNNNFAELRRLKVKDGLYIIRLPSVPYNTPQIEIYTGYLGQFTGVVEDRLSFYVDQERCPFVGFNCTYTVENWEDRMRRLLL